MKINQVSFENQRFKGAGRNRKVSTSFRSLLTKRHWRLATPALLVLFSQKSTFLPMRLRKKCIIITKINFRDAKISYLSIMERNVTIEKDRKGNVERRKNELFTKKET